MWGGWGAELEAGRRLSPNLERFLVSIQAAFQELCLGPRPGPEWATLKLNRAGGGEAGGGGGALGVWRELGDTKRVTFSE